MFCRTKSNGKYQYLQIVENRREGGKVRQRVVANLGRLDVLTRSGALDRLIASALKFSENLVVVAERARKEKEGGEEAGFDGLSIGPSMVFGRLWELTGCGEVVGEMLRRRRFGFDVERAVFMSVLHRLTETGSDRRAIGWREGQAIEGTEELDLHHLYRAMSWLGEEIGQGEAVGKDGCVAVARCVKDEIEEKLYRRRADLFSGLELVFFDTTSLYFTGQGGEMGDYGISKDHRSDCKQVVLGVVVDGEGTPVCSQVWPGNTADVSVLRAVARRLAERFNIRRVCVVADKGMISKDNVTELVEMGWEYILGARHRNCAEVMEWIVADDAPMRLEKIERDGGKEPFYIEVKEVLMKDSEEEKERKVKKGRKPYPPRRYVMCRTQQQASRDAAVRQKIVAGLEEKLRTDPKSLVANKGYSRYLKTRTGGMEVDYAKIEREEKLDGIWVLQTNSSAPAARIAWQYKNLWQVEHLFRAAKSLLRTRPVYHQSDAAIRGHVFCSFLALVLRKELLRRMEAEGIESEWNDIIRNLDSLTETKIETGGKSFVVRSTARGATGAILRSLGLRLPPVIRREDGRNFIERQTAAD